VREAADLAADVRPTEPSTAASFARRHSTRCRVRAEDRKLVIESGE